MQDIRRRDWKVFIAEAASLRTVVGVIAVAAISSLFFTAPGTNPVLIATIGGGAIGWIIFAAFLRSIEKRFHHQRFKYLWQECQIRHKKLTAALDKSRRNKFAELSELERTVNTTIPEIYRALRRADLVLRDIQQTENYAATPLNVPGQVIHDQQAQELYKVADRNIAEYTHYYKQAVAGVERSEAQCVVFSTTLDALRIRLLNYSLVGRNPEAETKEFLNMVAEARMQFAAIDQALDEIELMPMAQTIHTLPSDQNLHPNLEKSPPPIPKQAEDRIKNNQ
jgi:hypothetical protein